MVDKIESFFSTHTTLGIRFEVPDLPRHPRAFTVICESGAVMRDDGTWQSSILSIEKFCLRPRGDAMLLVCTVNDGTKSIDDIMGEVANVEDATQWILEVNNLHEHHRIKNEEKARLRA